MKVLIGHIGRLPNIKGDAEFRISSTSGYQYSCEIPIFHGSFYTEKNIRPEIETMSVSGKDVNTYHIFHLNASYSSNCYQDNSLPESKSLSVKYWLRIC